MRTLENRLRSLDQMAPSKSAIDTILITLVTPGKLDAPSVRVEGKGQAWHLHPGESQEDFTERVRREVERSPGEVVRLTAYPAD